MTVYRDPDDLPERDDIRSYIRDEDFRLGEDALRELRNLQAHFPAGDDAFFRELHIEIKPFNELDPEDFERFVQTQFGSVDETFVISEKDGETVLHGPIPRFGRGEPAKKIHKPAGHVALKLTRFFYTKDTFERVFQAAILDFQAEHYEALAEGRRLKAGLRRVQLACLVVGLVIRHGIQKLITPLEPVLAVFRGG